MEKIIIVDRISSQNEIVGNFLRKMSNMRNIGTLLDSTLHTERSEKYPLVFSILESSNIRIQAKSMSEINAIRNYMSKSTKKQYKIQRHVLNCEDDARELAYILIKELRKRQCML